MRRAAWGLAICLTVSAIGGCAKKTGPSEDSMGGESQTEARSPVSGQNETEPGAMGRYGETKVQLPQSIEEQSFIQFIRGKDGAVDVFKRPG